jgi:hypothetical protein
MAEPINSNVRKKTQSIDQNVEKIFFAEKTVTKKAKKLAKMLNSL